VIKQYDVCGVKNILLISTDEDTVKICIGYFEATRGYVIYSPRRAAPR
jgi:hypothetical protein